MNTRKQRTHVFLLLLAVHLILVGTSWGESTFMSPPPVSGRVVSPETILPADVLARVQWFRDELEAIRFEMGVPKDRRITRMATNAFPHEVYFQAATLFIKADRLALELNGSTGIRPDPVAPLEVRPFHTWLLVTAAYNRLMTVKTELGIQERFPEKLQPSSTTPVEVGRAIVHSNRQLNLMLQRRFVPSDVFQQVLWGVEYANALLAQFPEARNSRLSPPLERGKLPADVFLRLVECFGRVEEIAHLSGMEVLHLDVTAAQQAVLNFDIQPSDVYDLATLLVSDLTYLYGKIKDPRSIQSVPFPGRKFPSHVYQQTAVLLGKLRELEKQVRANPNWTLEPTLAH
ncbi:MAG: hypothetical protein KC594_18315 [Nitrospira sp.]|nr:hypothetical protein [Nitrospira sp.]HBP90532.1 hypothetical protein [Nitrospiraceae bacterium]HNP27856.1 hypothetical protein [Nitrospirales bacterium]